MAVKIEAKVTGLNDLLRNIDITANATTTAIAAGVAQVAIDAANYAKENHPYKNRTTNMETSVEPMPVTIDGTQVNSGVHAPMPYSVHLEYGTSKMKPYPSIIPAVEANQNNLEITVAAVAARAQLVAKVVRA